MMLLSRAMRQSSYVSALLQVTMQNESTQLRSGNGKRAPNQSPPLILVTNDDGIQSPGLLAVVEAVCDLGDIIVAAPQRQYSNAGRSHPPSALRDDSAEVVRLPVKCPNVRAYALDSSPAQTVLRALVNLVPRLPDLAISGINYGENMGTGVTVSGTVGAALEAASAGVPALAVSLQTPHEFHFNASGKVDFSVAAAFARRFARMVLRGGLPFDVDVLKIDVPDTARLDTPWRLTRVSRQSYYVATRERRLSNDGTQLTNYVIEIDWDTLEPDSDIYALTVDRVVSVSPLSIDLTSRVDLSVLTAELKRRNHDDLKSPG